MGMYYYINQLYKGNICYGHRIHIIAHCYVPTPLVLTHCINHKLHNNIIISF